MILRIHSYEETVLSASRINENPTEADCKQDAEALAYFLLKRLPARTCYSLRDILMEAKEAYGDAFFEIVQRCERSAKEREV